MGNFVPHTMNAGVMHRALVLCLGTFLVAGSSLVCWTALASDVRTDTLSLMLRNVTRMP
jgi:hypothetical protein